VTTGERTRAGLALLQACGTNVLVLDKPTNHLDLAAIEQLEQGEQALEAYDGALLLVTRDRRMLQNVRLDRTWLVNNGQGRERPLVRAGGQPRPSGLDFCSED
jgi:ATPase subunit of ABC transporter with duplicated ATPase domains